MNMETRSSRKRRLPEEGSGSGGAGPATQVSANDQRDEILQRDLTREHPETATASSSRNIQGEAEIEEDSAGSQQDRVVQVAARRYEPTKRIKWDRDMNSDVLRAYFRTNECQDNPLPGWRFKLHAEFTRMYPTLGISEQNIVDRKRIITSKKYLTDIEIEEIRREVGRTLHNQQVEEEILEDTPAALDEPVPETELEREQGTSDLFAAMCDLFHGTDPLQRPGIPQLIFKPGTNRIISSVDELIGLRLADTADLDEIHLTVYAAAATVLELNGQILRAPNQRSGNHDSKEPAWRTRLMACIDSYRAQVDIISEYQRGNRRPRVLNKVNGICANLKLSFRDKQFDQKLLEYQDLMRQKLKAKAARLKRYNKTTKRKEQNRNFKRNQKRFYRDLERPKHQSEGVSGEVHQTYWEGIWSVPQQYNRDATWLHRAERQSTNIGHMEEVVITTEDVQRAAASASNWRAPGPDGLHSFWYKSFSSVSDVLARALSGCLRNPGLFPQWMTTGITYLIYKKGEADDPRNYRPITCLPTIYKLFTSILTEKIYDHCTTNGIIAEEQKGGIRGSMGCKEQLTIDAIVLKLAKTKMRTLYMAYVDYQKAFDSVPHDWLMRVLDLYRISPSIRDLLGYLIQGWTTKLNVSGSRVGTIPIRRGIFQGDSLSPLWFVLCLNPLSGLLKDAVAGFRPNIRNPVRLSHLFFMDDLKLYAENKRDLQSLIKITRTFSEDIGMRFGYEKCACLRILKGNLVMDEDIEGVRPLEVGETYAYLGMRQNQCIDHTALKAEFKQRYTTRVTKLLNTLLWGRNLITAINAWAVPTLMYSFGVLKYSDADLNELDRTTRRLMTKFRCHHPGTAADRLYLPRRQGGRGLTSIAGLCRKQEQNLRKYFLGQHGPLIELLKAQDANYTPLHLGDPDHRPTPIIAAPDLAQTWRSKVLHGKYPNTISENWVDTKVSLKWLESGYLFPETEGFLTAIQDRVISTRNYRKFILKEDVVDRCRKCDSPGETIEHVMGACPALADNVYLSRHNQVAKIIHIRLAQKYNLIENPPPYYKYTPAAVLENRDTVLYWDRQVITDRTVDHNRPDLLLIEKSTKQATIIDVGIPLNHNVQKTEKEKVNKYANLAMEMKNVWKLTKVTTIPIIISTEGVASHNLRKNLERLGLPEGLSTLIQKAAILQTCHLVRKFLGD